MKKRSIALRLKILLVLSLLPILGIAAFLFIAIKEFQDDKKAYVFDSSFVAARAKAAIVQTEIQSLVQTYSNLILGYDLVQEQFTASAFESLKRNRNIQAIEIYKWVGVGGEKKASFTQEGLAESKIEFWPELKNTLSEVKTEGLKIKRFTNLNSEQIIFALRFANPRVQNDPEPLIMIGLIQSKSIADQFADIRPTMSLLVSDTGHSIFSHSVKVAKGQEWPINQIIQSIRKVGREGSAEIKAPNGEPFLVSVASVPFDKLKVVSLISRQDAFRATEVILKKSLMYFILIVSAVAFVAIFSAHRLTSALGELYDGTRKIATGDFTVQVEVDSQDEVGELAESFNLMAVEVARLINETAEKARMQSELETAKTVQETLFPESFKQMGRIQVSGYYEPASECGGDWWFHAEDSESVFIFVGDATGHGVPAALLTSAARASVSVLQSSGIKDVAQSMEILNRALYHTSRGRVLMTFFMGVINKKTGEMRYCNASHESPYLLHKTDDTPTRQDFEPLMGAIGRRLGESITEGTDGRYVEEKIQLQPGDRLIMYTDGITDLLNPQGESLGERKFLKVLAECLGSQNETPLAVGQITEQIRDFRQGAPLKDDVTVVLLKVA